MEHNLKSQRVGHNWATEQFKSHKQTPHKHIKMIIVKGEKLNQWNKKFFSTVLEQLYRQRQKTENFDPHHIIHIKID